MKLPEILKGPSLTRLLQGAAVGAIVIVAIGFNWFGAGFGWVTSGTAKLMAAKAGDVALVPVCAEKMRANPAAMVKLNAAGQDYVRTQVVQEFIKTVGGKTVDYSSASNCSDELKKPMAQASKS